MVIDLPVSITEELGEWNNERGIDVPSWIGLEGNYRFAVGYAELFWPRFQTLGKYICREQYTNKQIEDFESQLNFNPKFVEATINHLHLYDLHGDDHEGKTADKLLFLLATLKEIYQAKLQLEFPDRPCVVETNVPEDVEALDEYTLSFWQKSWDERNN